MNKPPQSGRLNRPRLAGFESTGDNVDLHNGLAAYTEFRVHLWHLGFLAWGDQTYLPNMQLGRTQTLAIGDPPLWLHAERVRFLQPFNSELVECNAPLPSWAQ